MAKHLSAEQITKYRERTLQPGELMAVDSHLGNSTECRNELSGQSPPESTRGFLDAIREAKQEHLTFDQMDAWVEDQMDQTERELVMAHIGLCQSCARELKAYETYAHKMSAPVQPVAAPQQAPVRQEARVEALPAQPVMAQPVPARKIAEPSLGEKLRAFFFSPKVALAMLAIAAAAIVTPILLNNNQTREGAGGGRTIDSVNIGDLENLPASIRTGAEAVARARGAERPSSLDGLAPNSDPFLQYPVSEVVEDRQPELRWKPFASSYTVHVYNSQNMLVSRSELITDTHWLVPIMLERGATYNWEVVGLGDEHRAQLRVLGDAAATELAQLRSTRGTEHFVLGTVAQQYGMLTVARREFETLIKQRPQSEEAARLLTNVNALIGER
jgi:anti-sigma factor ChrR (cupin superfamily)